MKDREGVGGGAGEGRRKTCSAASSSTCSNRTHMVTPKCLQRHGVLQQFELGPGYRAGFTCQAMRPDPERSGQTPNIMVFDRW